MSDEKKQPIVPFVPMDDDYAAYTALMTRVARSAYAAATANSFSSPPFPVTGELPLPVLVSEAVIIPSGKHKEGELIRAVTLPLLKIIALISGDPAAVLQIDDRKWEEIIAAAYEESCLFDRVILTPRSGDGGRM